MEDAVSSLSAILLDDEYYGFVLDGRRSSEGITYVGEDRLIPLKACAWLELTARRAKGENIDSTNIRKHANDVLRLSQLLAATSNIPAPGKIVENLREFLVAIQGGVSLNPRSLGIKATIPEVCGRVARAYGLEWPTSALNEKGQHPERGRRS